MVFQENDRSDDAATNRSRTYPKSDKQPKDSREGESIFIPMC